MFSLIITIVSIALVVALIAATMYYGGDTLTEGRAKSDAAAYVSGGQQVVGALQMYNAMEGGQASDLEGLTEDSKYLASLPLMKSGNTWAIDTSTRTLTIDVNDEAVCKAVNSQVIDGEDIPTTLAAGVIYACIGASGTANALNMRY